MGKFRTILADPPWPYTQPLGRGTRAGQLARGGLPYQSLSIEEIQALPVGRLADVDCQCWLWTTNAHIHPALHTLECWGFEYKTMLTWAKPGIGLGYWLRGQTEHLLLGVKGHPRSKMIGPHGATGHAWSTLLSASGGPHSQKPPASYDLVEAIGESPYLELFARTYHLGWEIWGDAVQSSIQENPALW